MKTFHRRGILILAILLLIKIPWEHRLQQELPEISALSLPQQLQQGLVMGALSGFRSVIADLLWIQIIPVWEKQQWPRVEQLIALASTLQPRSILFWEMGAHYLAWDASLDHRRDWREPHEARRLWAEQQWIQAGIRHLERGLSFHPHHPKLWIQLGWVYFQRKGDYRRAAENFQKAAQEPNCPHYVERLAGYSLEKTGDMAAAYLYWKSLLDQPVRPGQPRDRRPLIEKRLRILEKELSLSKQPSVQGYNQEHRR